MNTKVIIYGTHCHSCKVLLEEVISELAGIRSVTVDFASGRTVIEHDQDLVWEELQQVIRSVGDYQLSVLESHQAA